MGKKDKKEETIDYEDVIHPKKDKRGVVVKVVVIGIAACFVGICLLGSFYSLKENEYAVITTFGTPSVVEEPGIHVKIPFVQELNIVPKTINGFMIGSDEVTGEYKTSESFMITRDYNFVNVDFYVEYRVTDPKKYLYASENPVDILKNLTQSYIRDTIGLYDVDSVITTGKSEIQASIKEKILKRLEQEDLGITLVSITIQDAEPPTAAVQEAFKAVETAKQDAETATNNANKYANEVLPAAKADADEILQKAEAYKAARINAAEGQASRFRQLFEEYAKYPEITKQRLFYEVIGDIFPEMKVIIMGKDGNQLQTVLPLEPLIGTSDAGNSNE